MWNTTDAEIETKLSPGEKLLWCGQPRQGIRLHSYDWQVIPISLFVCAFAICWEWRVITHKAPLLFALSGIPLLLAGIYFVAGRLFVDAKMRARTVYGVTSQRIIIITGLFSRRTKSLSLGDLFGVNLSERSDGSGTITFGPQNPYAWRIPGLGGSFQSPTPAFEMIEHAKETYDLIRQTEETIKQAERTASEPETSTTDSEDIDELLGRAGRQPKITPGSIAFGCIFLLVFSGFIVWHLVVGTFPGGRGHSISRHDNPSDYWLWMGGFIFIDLFAWFAIGLNACRLARDKRKRQGRDSDKC